MIRAFELLASLSDDLLCARKDDVPQPGKGL
jgi:hypothetical protein